MCDICENTNINETYESQWLTNCTTQSCQSKIVCKQKISAKCDIYTGLTLTAFGVTSGQNMEDVLKAIDTVISTLSASVQNCCASLPPTTTTTTLFAPTTTTTSSTTTTTSTSSTTTSTSTSTSTTSTTSTSSTTSTTTQAPTTTTSTSTTSSTTTSTTTVAPTTTSTTTVAPLCYTYELSTTSINNLTSPISYSFTCCVSGIVIFGELQPQNDIISICATPDSVSAGTGIDVNILGGCTEDLNDCITTTTSTTSTTSTTTLTPLTLDLQQQPACEDTTVTLVASGGNGNYLYSIDNGDSLQSSPTFTGLIVGAYQAIVYDTTGNFKILQFEIVACTTTSTTTELPTTTTTTTVVLVPIIIEQPMGYFETLCPGSISGWVVDSYIIVDYFDNQNIQQQTIVTFGSGVDSPKIVNVLYGTNVTIKSVVQDYSESGFEYCGKTYQSYISESNSDIATSPGLVQQIGGQTNASEIAEYSFNATVSRIFEGYVRDITVISTTTTTTELPTTTSTTTIDFSLGYIANSYICGSGESFIFGALVTSSTQLTIGSYYIGDDGLVYQITAVNTDPGYGIANTNISNTTTYTSVGSVPCSYVCCTFISSSDVVENIYWTDINNMPQTQQINIGETIYKCIVKNSGSASALGHFGNVTITEGTACTQDNDCIP